MQQGFVRAYLDHDRPADALHWLDGHWAHLESSRLRLLAETLAKLGRASDSAAVRKELFDEVGDEALAEGALVDNADRVDGNHYGKLVPLAEALEARGLLRGATACCRALLLAILARAYVRVYGHAARYFKRLGEIAGRQPDVRPLAPHESFVAVVRTQHARKVAFWSYVAHCPKFLGRH